jgi:multiple sugar transport system permease protein
MTSVVTAPTDLLSPTLGLTPRAATQQQRIALAGLLFSLPAVLLLVLLVLAPLVAVVGLSFTDYSLGATEVSFIGFANYARLFTNASALQALTNTVVYVAIVVPAAAGLGLFIAALVHRRTRSRKFYQLAFFLPVTSTMVAMAVVWQYLLHGRIGPINAALTAIGLPRFDFLTNPEIALYAIAAVGVWQLVGFAMILFLAGFTSIPSQVYEAAELDGIDNCFDRFWRITWPLLAPTTLFVVITTTITAFQVFDTVAVLTKGGPMKSTEVLLYRVYLEGFQYFEIGRAAAMMTVFLVIILGFSLLQFRLAERRIHYGGDK